MTHPIAQLRAENERTPANVAAHIAGFDTYDDTPRQHQARLALIARDNVVLIFGLAICKHQHTGWLAARTQVYQRLNPWLCIHTEMSDLQTLADKLAKDIHAGTPKQFWP